MLILDLEGVIINDLWDRNWEHGNIEAIKNFIKTECYDDRSFSIFTYGWLNRSDIDWELIHMIEDKLDLRCKNVFVKADVLDKVSTRSTYTPSDEMEIAELLPSIASKETGMEMLFDNVGDDFVYFIDDTVQDKSIMYGRFNDINRRQIHFINIDSI